ncbi:MAG: hypothetical protein U1E87_06950 [Alphaproteobacteria bacterium]
MRGLGEGHYPWPVDNPEPMTTMTNGNVEVVTGVTDGQVIKVSYKGGVTEIIIPDTVVIQVTEIVGKENLQPGAKVSINAAINSDGSLTARASSGSWFEAISKLPGIVMAGLDPRPSG